MYFLRVARIPGTSDNCVRSFVRSAIVSFHAILLRWLNSCVRAAVRIYVYTCVRNGEKKEMRRETARSR